MAKKKASTEPNKSQLIRDYLKAHPAARGVDVVEALAKTGVTVAPAQVSNVKIAMEKKSAGKKKGPKNSAPSATGVVATVEAAKQLIAAAGSVEDAKKLLDVLS